MTMHKNTPRTVYLPAVFEIGSFRIYELPTPHIRRKVTIDPSLYYDLDPAPGTLYVESHSDLVITLTPRAVPEGYVPKVTTDRRIYHDDIPGSIRLTANDDGTYTVRIVSIIEETVVTITAVPPTSNEPAAPAAQVWSYGSRLYIRSQAPGLAALYHVNGMLLKQLPLAPGETHSEALSAGVYIVRLDGKSYKVVLH